MQIKRVQTRVSRIVRETPDTVTITLDLGGEPFEYKAGQAVGIDPNQFDALKAAIAAREQPQMERSYSLASHPAQRGVVEITAKEEPTRDGVAPLLSPYFVRSLREGDRVVINGPFGLYTLPDDLTGIDHALHICAGSGVVPSRAIINDARPGVKHTLLLQNRTEADIIYRAEWGRGTATVVHVLSRPGDDWTGERGYVTADLVRRHVTPATIAFVCGPNAPRGNEPGFRDKMLAVLKEIGLDRKRIKKESW